MNEAQQKAINLAEEWRDKSSVYSIENKRDIVYGIILLAVDLKAWSDELGSIWRDLEERKT